MPRDRTSAIGHPEPTLVDAFQRLTRGGARWVEAEFALARTETALILRRIAVGVGVAIAAMIVLLTTLVIFAQAAVASLADVLGGSAYAGLAVGFGLLFCVVLLALVAKRLLTAGHPQLASPVLRWVAGMKTPEGE